MSLKVILKKPGLKIADFQFENQECLHQAEAKGRVTCTYIQTVP